jgi:hypothetical protein
VSKQINPKTEPHLAYFVPLKLFFWLGVGSKEYCLGWFGGEKQVDFNASQESLLSDSQK